MNKLLSSMPFVLAFNTLGLYVFFVVTLAFLHVDISMYNPENWGGFLRLLFLLICLMLGLDVYTKMKEQAQ